MSYRRNFLDADNSGMEKNLRFVRNDVEDNFNQYFGGNNSSRSGNARDIAPPRDYRVVQPKPVDMPPNRNNNAGFAERKDFLLEVGLPRHKAYEIAKENHFDIGYYRQKTFEMCKNGMSSSLVSDWIVEEIQSDRYCKNVAADNNVETFNASYDIMEDPREWKLERNTRLFSSRANQQNDYSYSNSPNRDLTHNQSYFDSQNNHKSNRGETSSFTFNKDNQYMEGAGTSFNYQHDSGYDNNSNVGSRFGNNSSNPVSRFSSNYSRNFNSDSNEFPNESNADFRNSLHCQDRNNSGNEYNSWQRSNQSSRYESNSYHNKESRNENTSYPIKRARNNNSNYSANFNSDSMDFSNDRYKNNKGSLKPFESIHKSSKSSYGGNNNGGGDTSHITDIDEIMKIPFLPNQTEKFAHITREQKSMLTQTQCKTIENRYSNHLKKIKKQTIKDKRRERNRTDIYKKPQVNTIDINVGRARKLPGNLKPKPHEYWQKWWSFYKSVEAEVEYVDANDPEVRSEILKNTSKKLLLIYAPKKIERTMTNITEQNYRLLELYKFLLYFHRLQEPTFLEELSATERVIVDKALGLISDPKLCLVYQGIIAKFHMSRDITNRVESGELLKSKHATALLNNKTFHFFVGEAIRNLKAMSAKDWPQLEEVYPSL